MSKVKFQSKRPYLSIAEATKEYACTEDDLIYEASIGEITLYILADNWQAGQIYAVDLTKGSSNLSVKYSGPKASPVPDSIDDDEFEKQYQAWVNGQDGQDITIGPSTFYGKYGSFRGLYERSWSGHLPIATEAILDYRKGSVASLVELDVNKSLDLKDKSAQLFLRPDPEILFQEALKHQKLFVMKDDLDRLSGLSPDENLSELYEQPNWPEELKIAIEAWQAVQGKDMQGVGARLKLPSSAR